MANNKKSCRQLLASNLRRLRAGLGTSQLNFSEQVDISTTFLSDLELGKKWVSADTLDRFADVFHVEVAELFRDPDEVHEEQAMEKVEQYLDSVEETLVEQTMLAIEPGLRKRVGLIVKNIRTALDDRRQKHTAEDIPHGT